MRVVNSPLKKAMYHLMKKEMKLNKRFKEDGYKEKNEALLKAFSLGEALPSESYYPTDGNMTLDKAFYELRSLEEMNLLFHFFMEHYGIDSKTIIVKRKHW